MASLFNLAKMTTATVGAGTITLGAAVSGFLSFAGAGVPDGTVVGYAIADGSNSEIGTGTYTAAGTTLSRTVISSTNGNAAIALSGTAQVFITPSNRDFMQVGTLMLFQQTAAPLGWTKQTAHNDKALRVVSGTASSGGTNAFSTVMAQTVVGSTILTLSQIPSHTHGIWNDSTFAGSATVASGGGGTRMEVNNTKGTPSGSAGGDGSHNHTITMNMAYVDLIIASKD